MEQRSGVPGLTGLLMTRKSRQAEGDDLFFGKIHVGAVLIIFKYHSRIGFFH